MSQPIPGAGPPPLPSRPLRPAPPPRKGLHGCLIALIVAACLAIPVVAILAAIAIPAYNDYLARSKVGQALADIHPMKGAVAAFATGHRRCPVNGDPGFQPADAYRGDSHASVVFGESDEGVCAIEVLLQDDRHETVDGYRLWLEYDTQSGAWHCSSEAEDRYLPAHCRG
ncbi:fimbrial protein [Luteimonas viscosa]|uniref:Fimbrial protein n=1 Tax=Luteimonas viscosa TaxID=1132694 RepID=A0A5D4XT82_9GAMM|nr:pilin [Luteimonas viscosa]TYT25970.1 fimbrial protein [Luteimonas viscosa]